MSKKRLIFVNTLLFLCGAGFAAELYHNSSFLLICMAIFILLASVLCLLIKLACYLYSKDLAVYVDRSYQKAIGDQKELSRFNQKNSSAWQLRTGVNKKRKNSSRVNSSHNPFQVIEGKKTD